MTTKVTTLQLSLIFLLAWLWSAASHGIIIRHDRDDDRYRQLAERYPAVGWVGDHLADGTLIHPRYVLTAAHVAEFLQRSAEKTVTIAGQTLAVDAVFLHPEWTPMGVHDIALLRLAEPFTQIEPLALYDSDEELGQVATLVGHGETGRGNDPKRHEDHAKRGATNAIARVTRDSLVFEFETPPAGTDLEGTPGSGDSGGPALLLVDGRPTIAGVSSMGEPGHDGPGSYGATDTFVRVSTHRPWIDAVLGGRVEPADAPASLELPDSVLGQRMQSLLDLVLEKDAHAIEPFVDSAFSPLPAERKERMIEALRGMQRTFRGYTAISIVGLDAERIDLLLEGPDGPRILGLEVDSLNQRIRALLSGEP